MVLYPTPEKFNTFNTFDDAGNVASPFWRRGTRTQSPLMSWASRRAAATMVCSSVPPLLRVWMRLTADRQSNPLIVEQFARAGSPTRGSRALGGSSVAEPESALRGVG